jgi:streptogramin lyase
VRCVAACLGACLVLVGGASAGGVEGPVSLTVGYGSVWVGFGEGKIVRFDPKRGRASRIIEPSLTGFVGSMATGFGSVWAARHDGTVVRLDGKTGRRLKTISLNATSLAAGARHIWAADGQRTLRRIDPRTNRVTGARRVPGLLWGEVAAGPAGVWIQSVPSRRVTGAAGPRILWRVNPRSLELTRVMRLKCDAQLAVTRTVWALDMCNGSVFRPSQEPVDVSGTGADIAIGAGSVWVTDGSVVHRVDPVTRKVSARIAARGSTLRVGEDAVWVLDVGDAVVGWLRRIDPATNRVVGRPVRLAARG